MNEKNRSPKAHLKIKQWKQSFLDLSNRSPQLKPNLGNTVEIIHPDIETLFRIIVVYGQKSCFISVWDKKKNKKKNTSKSSSKELYELDEKESPEVESSNSKSQTHLDAIEKKKNSAHLTDIISDKSDSALNTRLKGFIQKAKEAEEERGISILYLTFGLLTWFERNDPENFISTPILFVPVKLVKESLKSPYELEVLTDDVFVNPSLKSKLSEFRIKLPNFPDEFESSTMRDYWRELDDSLSIQKDWSLENRIFLGVFSFTKMTLYDDLENNDQLIDRHPIVRAIANEAGFAEPKENLPSEEDLTDLANPTKSYAILDSDSSQNEAIIYVKHGASIVIQGPPGTGKSQCIANIIAECLAEGKKVLFVAQKQAALNVVQNRLSKCGIGDFCLQIHSQTANKVELLKQIEKSMNYIPETINIRKEKYQELKLLRERLNEYVDLINQKQGEMHFSVYDLMGRLLTLEEIPFLNADIRNPNNVSEMDFITIKEKFNELEQFRITVENYDHNPWCYAKITSPLILSNELKLVLRARLTSFSKCNEYLKKTTLNLKDKYPLSELAQVAQKSEWQKKIGVIRYWYDIIKNLLNEWMILKDDYSEIRQYFILDDVIDFRPLDFQSLRQIYLAYKNYLNVEESHQTIQEFLLSNINKYLEKMEQFNNRIIVFNLKSKLNPINKLIDLMEMKQFFDIYHSKSLLLDVDLLLSRFTIDYTNAIKRRGDQFNDDKNEILECTRKADPKSNLMGHLNRIKQFQDKYGRLIGEKPDYIHSIVVQLFELVAEWKQIQDSDDLLHPLFAINPIDLDIEEEIWKKNEEFATEWLQNLPHLNDWFEVQVRVHHLNDLGVLDLFHQIINRQFENIPYTKIFEKCFFTIWMRDLVESLPPIENFDSKFHQSTIMKFRSIDQEILSLNQIRLQQLLFQRRPQSDLDASDLILSQIGMIKRELKKKRNIKPLRTLFTEAQEYLSLLKPCFMMSPLTIANYLALDKYEQYFDTIIFDEASQVTPEDAIGAILRGKSLVVVGDSQQLPPTQFFTSTTIISDLDDYELDLQHMESLLDECTGIGIREKMLRFHYRSRKEGLIAFSNLNYYNGRLNTFPDIRTPFISDPDNSLGMNSNQSRSSDNYADINSLSAIEFHHIKNGIKHKGTNIIEAQALADAVILHYKNNHDCHTNYSLGVIAFSQAQQETIQKALEKKIKSQPDLESLIYGQKEENFFIKNLENVQGDERDFIFFSVGYARDENGKMSLNFGPLNRNGGYRRLNVAITRARFHIKLFASFLPSEIPMDKVNARGLEDLLNYMFYARTGQIMAQKHHHKDKLQLPASIEEDVKKTLQKEGYLLHSDVGASSYRVSLAIIDPQGSNRYVLGLECDGGSYQTATNARDRDRIRNEVLRGLGWKIYHIWAPDWYKNKNIIVNEIKSLLMN